MSCHDTMAKFNSWDSECIAQKAFDPLQKEQMNCVTLWVRRTFQVPTQTIPNLQSTQGPILLLGLQGWPKAEGSGLRLEQGSRWVRAPQGGRAAGARLGLMPLELLPSTCGFNKLRFLNQHPVFHFKVCFSRKHILWTLRFKLNLLLNSYTCDIQASFCTPDLRPSNVRSVLIKTKKCHQ